MASADGIAVQVSQAELNHSSGSEQLQAVDRNEGAVHVTQSQLNERPAASSSWKQLDYFSHERLDVLQLVPQSARRILEIGCGKGRLGAALKQRQGTYVVGLERNTEAAAMAETVLDEVLCIDVERDEITYKNGSFDCIICADVLEHLRSPEKILRRIHDLLTPDGTLITSLPNVQNRSVLQSLLSGNWTYEAAGLLDEDHVRFFTRREIEKLLSRAGFAIEEFQMVPSEGFQEWVDKGRPAEVTIGNANVKLPTPEAAAELYAYQYLTRARRLEKSQDDLTSIILVTHNQCAYTQACLESIRLRTDEPYELIVIDNASTDSTIPFLQSAGIDHLILNETNRGFPSAVNQGIAVARGENILLLNNDTIVTTGWLRRMLDVLKFDEKIGLVGPVSNCVSGEQQVQVTYRQLAELDGFAWDWGKSYGHRLVETNRLVGFCLLIRRSVIESIGLLDEQFGIGNFEDDDFCRRAIAAGFRAVIAKGVFIHHFGSVTFRQSNIDFAGLLEQNQSLYLEKWSDSSSQGQNNGEKQSPRLSVCMIVRDNESTIRDCLESIRPWVDEMVVVDTGSTDSTPQICEELGARVIHWPWQESFSAARNISFENANGEWLFWMDSDDTIPAECGKKLRQLTDGSHDSKTLGYVIQVHCPGSDAGDFTAVDHVKLIRNRPDLRFEFRIHEQILPAIRRAGGDVGWTDLYVVHSGADRSEQGRARKLVRDLRLLELDLTERPDHPFVLFNLGMTYLDAEDYQRACACLKRCIEVSHSGESHLRKAFALLVASLTKQDEYESASKSCHQGLELFPEDQELIFRKAMLDHQSGRLTDAARGYRQLLAGQGERYFSSLDVGLCGYKASHNLAIVLEEMGLLDEAITQWSNLLEQREGYLPAVSALRRLRKSMAVAQVV